MDRRSFLKGGGIFGALFGAGAVSSLVDKASSASNEKTSKEIADQLESTPVSLHLHAGYDQIDTNGQERMRLTAENKFHIKPNPEYNNQINIAIKPGPDGELYVKTNGEWKKVATI